MCRRRVANQNMDFVLALSRAETLQIPCVLHCTAAYYLSSAKACVIRELYICPLFKTFDVIIVVIILNFIDGIRHNCELRHNFTGFSIHSRAKLSRPIPYGRANICLPRLGKEANSKFEAPRRRILPDISVCLRKRQHKYIKNYDP